MALQNPVYKDFSDGWRTNGDADKLRVSESPNILNVVVTPQGSIYQRKGSTKLMDESASHASKPITMLACFKKLNGTKEVLVAYDGLVKKLNMTTGATTDLPTPISGQDTDSHYGYATDDDIFYFCNGVDNMVTYDGSTNTAVTLTTVASTTFKTNIFSIRERKMFAVDAGNPSLLHRSRTGAITTFNYSSGDVVENSGTTKIGEGGTPVTALSSTNELYVFSQNRIFKTAYSTISGSTVFLVDEVMRGVGSLSDRSTIEIGNLMIFYDPVDESVQQIGYKENFPDIQLSGMSDAIRNVLQDEYDLSDSVAIHWKRKFLLSCKSSVDASANDTVLLFDLETKAIFPITGWHVNCWMEYEGDLYFGSSIGPFVYKAFDGNDDAGNLIPFTYTSRIESFGNPSIYKNAHMLYVEGTIDDLVKIDVTIVFDYGRDSITKTIEGNNEGYTKLVGAIGYIGESARGINPRGGVKGSGSRIYQLGIKLNAKKFQHAQAIFTSTGGIGSYSIGQFYFSDLQEDTSKLPSNRII